MAKMRGFVVGSAGAAIAVLAGSIVATPAQAAVAWHPGEFVYKSPANYGGVNDVAVGDVTGDGLNDIVVADYPTQSLVVVPGTGTDTAGEPVVTTLGPDVTFSPSSFALAKLDGDATLDVVVGTLGQLPNGSYQGHLLTLFGSPSGALVNPITATAPLVTGNVAAMNANGDSKPDIVVQTPSNLQIGLGNGDGTFTFPAQLKFAFPVSELGNAQARPVVGDLNGGPDDVAFGTHSVHVLLSGSAGTYADTTLSSPGSPVYSVAIGDFGDDGANDVVSVQGPGHPTLGRIDTWNGDGVGGFSPGTPIFADGDSFGLAVTDFDNDGRSDLMTANYGLRQDFPDTGRYPSSVNWIRSTPDGLEVLPVVPEQDFVAPGFGIAAGDINGDGVPDVAAATYNGLVLYRSYDDTTAPMTFITSGPGESARPARARGADASGDHHLARSRNRRPTFAFTAKEGGHREQGAAFTCRVDRKPWTPCRSPFKLPALKRGRHVFRARANDLAQNRGKPARVRFVVGARR